MTWPEEAAQSRAKRSRLLGTGLSQGADGSTGEGAARRPGEDAQKQQKGKGQFAKEISPSQDREVKAGWAGRYQMLQKGDKAPPEKETQLWTNQGQKKKAGRARHHPLTAGSAQQKPGAGHTPQQPGSQVTWDEAGQTEVKWGTSSLSCASPGSWEEGLPWWLRR